MNQQHREPCRRRSDTIPQCGRSFRLRRHDHQHRSRWREVWDDCVGGLLLSMDPPMMLICLNTSSTTHDRVAEAGRYAVNILAVEQGEIASHFARKGSDEFAGVAHQVNDDGVPLIEGALATIECEVVETASGGRTRSSSVACEALRRGPASRWRTSVGGSGALKWTREVAAYDDVRTWVLRRRTPLGEALEADIIAAELGTDVAFVYSALVRLTAEGLVKRPHEGGFTPMPVTVDLVDNLYHARAHDRIRRHRCIPRLGVG